MDLELLRTFLEVNRTRHFGEAAEALHLTQAAVSARIKQLESLLGARLFDRLRRDIRLTPEGSRLIRHADLLISGWRKARQEVSFGGAQQQLAVGGSLRLWDVLLQDWFHRVRRHLPRLLPGGDRTGRLGGHRADRGRHRGRARRDRRHRGALRFDS